MSKPLQEVGSVNWELPRARQFDLNRLSREVFRDLSEAILYMEESFKVVEGRKEDDWEMAIHRVGFYLGENAKAIVIAHNSQLGVLAVGIPGGKRMKNRYFSHLESLCGEAMCVNEVAGDGKRTLKVVVFGDKANEGEVDSCCTEMYALAYPGKSLRMDIVGYF